MSKKNRTITVALAGNPNCGKTALFNALTGSRQRVGNWPGVTVERQVGLFQTKTATVHVVDLPGIYSMRVLHEGALDERITCDYLFSGAADVMVNVLDGSNLVRHLYLTLQLLEMGLPVVLVVNMLDVVQRQGMVIDLATLSALTHCPVVGVIASQGVGVAALKEAVIEAAASKPRRLEETMFPSSLQARIEALATMIQEVMPQQAAHATELAVRLFEQDRYAMERVTPAIRQLVVQEELLIEKQLQEEADVLIADARYRLAGQWSDRVVQVAHPGRVTFTEKLDRVVLNRFLGIPIFLAMMYLLFLFSINVGGLFQDFFDLTSAAFFVDGLSAWLWHLHCPTWLIAVLANGLGRGVNTVMTFAPVIGALFLFLAFLEDCGYMARAAFVMDRLMQWLGLPGRSFVPMIVGFGCNVPAVMGARTLANPRDRILTVMMMPFMSCGARLAIFSVFASAFFPKQGAGLIFLLYGLGLVVAVLSGLVLRKTLLGGVPAPLVMELPSYHVPRVGALFRQAWRRLQGFVWRAGKYIVPICVLVGALNSVSVRGDLVPAGDARSLLSHLGQVITPVFSPMGIEKDNWPATVGLVTGVLAKEVVIGTLNSLYSPAPYEAEVAFNLWGQLKKAARSVTDNLLQFGAAARNPIAASEPSHELSVGTSGAMYQRFGGKASAFAYLLFVLLYFPCVSTMAAMRREIGARWAYFSMLWSTGLAYVLAVVSYQALTFVLHPLYSLYWMGVLLLVLAVTVLWMQRIAQQRGSNGGVEQNATAPS